MNIKHQGDSTDPSPTSTCLPHRPATDLSTYQNISIIGRQQSPGPRSHYHDDEPASVHLARYYTFAAITTPSATAADDQRYAPTNSTHEPRTLPHNHNCCRTILNYTIITATKVCASNYITTADNHHTTTTSYYRDTTTSHHITTTSPYNH